MVCQKNEYLLIVPLVFALVKPSVMKNYLLLTLLLLSIVGYGQNKKDKELVRQAEKFITENYNQYAPGCAVLIAKKGEVLLEKGFGMANLELQTPMKPEMVFRIGSITKEFTAISILQLAETGKLSLTDDIQQHLKNFRYKGKTITIENLLTHTSGIRGYEELDVKIPNAIRIDFAVSRVIDSLAKLSTEFEPGTQYNYSNSNYFLLGAIIEQVSGETYQNYLRKHILTPAGLNATFYESPTDLVPNRVSGYTFADGQYRNPDYISMSLVYSAGALRSTVGDLWKWHMALFNEKLVKNETLIKAFRPYILATGKPTEYGYGFFLRSEQGLKSIGHGGAIDGFQSMEVYYPEQDLYITLLCNSESPDFQRFFLQIADIMTGKQGDNAVKEIKLDENMLNQYSGVYTNEQYKVSIKVYKVNGRLYGDLSNGSGSNMVFIALTDTIFLLPDIKRIKTTASIVKENGVVTGLILTQEKPALFVRKE
jgi:CubicO group peptidase (beta-lactamase class C family)